MKDRRVVPPTTPPLLKHEAVSFDARSKLLERYEFRVGEVLVDSKDTSITQNAVDGLDAGCLVRNLAEYRYRERQIEVIFRERKLSTRVTCGVSNVEKSSRIKFALGLCEHFGL